MKPSISIITPIYNEQESLPELHQRLTRMSANRLPGEIVEIIFVDDGSDDKTPEILKNITRGNTGVRAIRLPKNCGKSNALAAGFKQANGDIIVTLDGDLQDRPENIPQLINTLRDGHDLVVGWKKLRRDPLEKRVMSKIFNTCVRLTWNIPLHDSNCGLKAMVRPAAGTLHNISGGSHRFIPVLVKKAGFKRIAETAVTHDLRKYGASKYGWSRTIDGFTGYLSLLLFGRITSDAQNMVAVSALGIIAAFILTKAV